ncbi:trimeric intracellular cation channel family protein [uncultured Corynebacterium sp.]|uniref:trimeric intracellular cation channel family protein n=1 Tax=uncultured Corynebacterium sp. TaxID=159447 RepID=UPI0026200817|nr:trimeric intracellular cation channel family protein [uncultured Corynebacterium sp.]
MITNLYSTLDLIGVLLNGIIGGGIARRLDLDFMGTLFLAVFTGLGGGMIRDTLMQVGPPIAIAEPIYMTMALIGGFISLLINTEGRWWVRIKNHGDALVLGVWAVAGSTKALTYGLPWQSAIALGFITPIGGGMLRDIAIGQMPSIFGGRTLYAVPAFLASCAMVGFHFLGYDAAGMIVAALVGWLLTSISYWRGWIVPSQIRVPGSRSVMVWTRRAGQKTVREVDPLLRRINGLRRSTEQALRSARKRK